MRTRCDYGTCPNRPQYRCVFRYPVTAKAPLRHSVEMTANRCWLHVEGAAEVRDIETSVEPLGAFL